MVRRVYVEKKTEYAGKARELEKEIKGFLGITSAPKVRLFIRYDVENISEEVYKQACTVVFCEPPVDMLYEEKLPLPDSAEDTHIFSVEALPGQFDQRADSAEQCIRFLKGDEAPVVRTAVTYMLTGNLPEDELARIKAHVMNPVDSRVAGEDKPERLLEVYPEPADVSVLKGFTSMD